MLLTPYMKEINLPVKTIRIPNHLMANQIIAFLLKIYFLLQHHLNF